MPIRPDSPIKVVSLARSKDRRAAFEANNAHLEFDFFDAVDGSKLTEQQLEDPRHFVHPLQFPSLGAYGCALSHLALWEQAAEQDRVLTVVEDDAIFRLDFAQASRRVLGLLPDGWDIVLWGWNFDSILSLMSLAGVSPAVLKFDQDLLRENLEAFRSSTEPSYPLGLDRCCGIPAYTISPAGARKFKAECFPMKDFHIYFPVMNRKIANTGVDMAMARTYSITKSYVAFPPLVVSPNDPRITTIQAPASAALGARPVG
jgi:GR25 family glycosyltransferase involved in LPS biosynthesis